MEIGAFRTYPEGYTPPDATPSEYQPIPLNKIEDFGVHADMYYTLDLSIFKTSLDSQIIKLLWNKYWANTLSASPLLSNDGFIGGQLEDLGEIPQAHQPFAAARCCPVIVLPVYSCYGPGRRYSKCIDLAYPIRDVVCRSRAPAPLLPRPSVSDTWCAISGDVLTAICCCSCFFCTPATLLYIVCGCLQR